MDYSVLVSDQIDEGRALIGELTRERTIDLPVALWVKRLEAMHWSLYLGSNTLASINIGDAFHLINLAMNRIDRKAIGLSDIKLILPTDPVARRAIELRDSRPDNYPRKYPYWAYEVGILGDPSIQTAYIYPREMGQMSREDVVEKFAALMSRAGAPIPSSITLRDGSSIQAVPTSIQLGVPGELRIVLHDVAGNTDRTVSADEVVSIR